MLFKMLILHHWILGGVILITICFSKCLSIEFVILMKNDGERYDFVATSSKRKCPQWAAHEQVQNDHEPLHVNEDFPFDTELEMNAYFSVFVSSHLFYGQTCVVVPT